MNAVKLAGIALVVAGVLGLIYGSFSYTKETHQAKLGPIELSVKEKETVNVPMWAGVGAIVIGGALLVLGNKKSEPLHLRPDKSPELSRPIAPASGCTSREVGGRSRYSFCFRARIVGEPLTH